MVWWRWSKAGCGLVAAGPGPEVLVFIMTPSLLLNTFELFTANSFFKNLREQQKVTVVFPYLSDTSAGCESEDRIPYLQNIEGVSPLMPCISQ